MLVRDIDRALDMRLHLRLRQNTEFFKSTTDLKMALPVFIYGKGDETWMSTYFTKSSMNQKINLIMRKFGGTEKEDTYVVDSRINNVKDLEVIKRLTEIPSFIVNRSDMSEGFLNVYARFHSSHMSEVSNLLAQYAADYENSRINWLGPSMGITNIISLIDSEYPLSLITYRVPLSAEDSVLAGIAKEKNVIAEVKESGNSSGSISAVLYSDHVISESVEGVQAISSDDRLYKVEVSNEFYRMVRDKANEQHIMRTRYFIKPNGNDIEVNVFLPRNSVYEYYSILYDIARIHNNNVVVSALLPYSADVWDFV